MSSHMLMVCHEGKENHLRVLECWKKSDILGGIWKMMCTLGLFDLSSHHSLISLWLIALARMYSHPVLKISIILHPWFQSTFILKTFGQETPPTTFSLCVLVRWVKYVNSNGHIVSINLRHNAVQWRQQQWNYLKKITSALHQLSNTKSTKT